MAKLKNTENEPYFVRLILGKKWLDVGYILIFYFGHSRRIYLSSEF